MDMNKKIILFHTFDATPKELWEAWTDPKMFAKWFNPAPGFDCIIHEYDVRIGGKIRFDMPQPNGALNTQERIFQVLDPYKEIVTESPDRTMAIRTLFEKTGNKTKMIIEVTGVPPEYQAGASEFWNGGFKKLENILIQNRNVVHSLTN